MAISISMEDHLQGSFSLIFVIVAILIGIRLILRYFQYKEKAFLYAGLTWIGMVSPWFNTAFNYLYVLISGNSMGDQFYVFLAYVWLPFAILAWILVLSTLIFKEKKKLLLGLGWVNIIVYEILFLIFIFTDYTIIAERTAPFNDDLSLAYSIYVLLVLIFVLVTGVKFGRESLKSTNREIRLKGLFIIIAFVSFTIGAFLDSGLIILTPIIRVFVRILLISSSFEFYFGFFLPNIIKKFFLGQD